MPPGSSRDFTRHVGHAGRVRSLPDELLMEPPQNVVPLQCLHVSGLLMDCTRGKYEAAAREPRSGSGGGLSERYVEVH